MRAKGFAVAVVLAAIAFTSQSSRVVLAQGCPTFFDGTCFNVGAGAEDSATAPAVAPLTIRQGPVNNPAGDPIGRNIQHTPTLVDLGGGKLVAAFYDFGSYNGSNNHYVGYAYSSDNGVTWTDAGRLPNSAKGESFNPVLAVSKSANAVFLLANDGTSFETIPVFKSTNAGHTFAAPVNGAPGYVGTSNAQFQPSMAIDNFAGSGTGNIYICWNRFDGSNPSEIRLSRSVNNGASFAPNLGRLVGPGGPGCFMTVSPNHQVSVFYLRGTDAGGQGGDNKLFMRRSTDRGVTFKPEVLVADLKTTTRSGLLQLHGNVYATSYPQAAVNPVAGRPYLYVVYNDDPTPPPGGSNADNGDIYLVRSTDNGVTWSGRLRINDDTAGDQFFPNIAFVNGGERLVVGYFSRSHDPLNFMFHRRARLAALNAAGAAVFEPSFEIGPDTLPLGPTSSPFVSNYLGEYAGIAGGDGAISAVWPDGRRPIAKGGYQYDIYFARIAVPPAGGKLGVSIAATPPSVRLGEQTTIKVTASATAGAVADAVVHLNPTFGLAFLKATPTSGWCTSIGQMVDCFLGTIPSGASRTVSIVTAGVESQGTRTVNLLATTSSKSAAPASFAGPLAQGSLNLPVKAPPRPAQIKTLTTGNVAIPIPNATYTSAEGVRISNVFVDMAASDIHGTVIRITPSVRLDFSPDEELILYVEAPSRGSNTFPSELAFENGGQGANFGNGSNSCSGTPTKFSDNFPLNIVDAVAPFAGRVAPSSPMRTGGPAGGDWDLTVKNLSTTRAGVIGCITIDIGYIPDPP